jgi:hypothetical protein
MIKYMMSVIMVSVVMLSVDIMSVLGVVLFSVILLSVVAVTTFTTKRQHRIYYFLRYIRHNYSTPLSKEFLLI